VWQRPHHLISHLAPHFRRIWFVEEPVPVGLHGATRLVLQSNGPVDRMVIERAVDDGPTEFDDDACATYLQELTTGRTPDVPLTVWLYTPMALPLALALSPSVLVYDVMDDLASFRFASPALALRRRQALREADVVFTGGVSLHRATVEVRPSGTHCFPSGVEPEHYLPAIAARAARGALARPVAGYVGVIDERVDFELVAGLAARLPDWDIQMIGPVVKVESHELPVAPNLRYLGSRPYTELPMVMAGVDVALMPFALNEATRSISPTKTLEYLAAGLPVVSTPVPDVVSAFSEVVAVRRDADGFARSCREALSMDVRSFARSAQPALLDHRWDAIAARMYGLMEDVRVSQARGEQTA
jgi:glycosyltransferase involved in cell wall biosynthesis